MEWIDDIKEWCIKTRSVQLDYYICMILRTVETDDEICVGHPQDFSLWIMMTMMIITNSAFIKLIVRNHQTMMVSNYAQRICQRSLQQPSSGWETLHSEASVTPISHS